MRKNEKRIEKSVARNKKEQMFPSKKEKCEICVEKTMCTDWGWGRKLRLAARGQLSARRYARNAQNHEVCRVLPALRSFRAGDLR